MLLWAVLTSIGCALLLLLLLALRRCTAALRRQLDFLKKHASNMPLRSPLPLCGLDELAEEINDLLERTAQAERTARAGQEQLMEAITNLSHDIRTPLTSLDGYFQLLEEHPEQRQRYAPVIRRRIDDLKRLLEGLFTFTRLQNDNWQLELEPVDLHKCLLDVIFSFYDQWKAGGVQPELEIQDAPCWVSGSPEALERVLQNLLKNALLHGDGDIRLTLRADKAQARFTCTNRVAQPEKLDMEQIFSRFYRQDSARTRSSTGLGLSIARGLSERMEGRLSARLDGNLFEITLSLPLIPPDSPAA
ncbi:MAG: HAMP domain-containing histidine kinase [Oscillospiraceae bacterium]|nr:HAMP domain-containing histidine kinase [Oscillospiraceae bacterium]